MFLSGTLLVLSCFLVSHAFNTKFVTEISVAGVSNQFFGYSVLLQSGRNSIVTVGAPKDRFVNNKQYGGTVFQCDVTGNKKCQTAFKPSDQMYKSPNGDFLGATLDGEDNADGVIMACAPRTPVEFRITEKKTYLYGSCVFRKNSSNIDERSYNILVRSISGSKVKEVIGNISYYVYGYGLFGFDISLYNKTNVICGVPRFKTTGASIIFPLSRFESDEVRKNVTVLPQISGRPNPNETETYFGYSVKAVEDLQSKETWFIAGAPRANNSMGKVTIYKYAPKNSAHMEIIKTFGGDEFGSYFGAAVLAVDVSNDKILDVIVGAPLSAGKTYDEGSVYFYKNLANGHKTISNGHSTIGSRFGTSIVSLGDIDLDGFNDIAISAPYEDNSDGAVYIYKGSVEGLENTFSQRLTSESFNPGFAAKGFGLGLSKGNDINNDGHNDLAIGAYKSDKAFIIRSYGIVIFQAFINTSINGIHDKVSEFDLEVRLSYSKRSAKLHVPTLDFLVSVDLDYRAIERATDEIVKISIGMRFVRKYRIKIKRITQDISPFTINVKLSLHNAGNVKALGPNELETIIPYVVGCREDYVCETGLSIKVKTESQKLTLGKDHQLALEASVNNDGDPAFDCMLIIEVPNFLRLGTIYNCKQNARGYSCPFSDKIDTNSTKTEKFVFDLTNGDHNSRQFLISINVTSFGVNKKSYKNKDVLKLLLQANTTAYIIGNSVPATLDIVRTPETEYSEVVHRFTIGKLGPSTLRLKVHVLIPTLEYNGEDVVTITGIKSGINNVPVICKPTGYEITFSENQLFDIMDTKNIDLNNGVLIYCNGDEECSRFTCTGSLDNSNELAVLEVTIRIDSSLLVKKYRHQLWKSNVLNFLPVAVQENSEFADDWLFDFAQLEIFVPYSKYAPFWVYIVGAVLGFMIFVIITIGLYRCKFFNREYKYLIQEHRGGNASARNSKFNTAEGGNSMMEGTSLTENEYVAL